MRFVNKYQTNEERRKKYHAVIKAGFPSDVARRVRDFTVTHAISFLKLMKPKDYN